MHSRIDRPHGDFFLQEQRGLFLDLRVQCYGVRPMLAYPLVLHRCVPVVALNVGIKYLRDDELGWATGVYLIDLKVHPLAIQPTLLTVFVFNLAIYPYSDALCRQTRYRLGLCDLVPYDVQLRAI